MVGHSKWEFYFISVLSTECKKKEREKKPKWTVGTRTETCATRKCMYYGSRAFIRILKIEYVLLDAGRRMGSWQRGDAALIAAPTTTQCRAYYNTFTSFKANQ